jgi:hypothetical protein
MHIYLCVYINVSTTSAIQRKKVPEEKGRHSARDPGREGRGSRRIRQQNLEPRAILRAKMPVEEGGGKAFRAEQADCGRGQIWI